MWQQLAQYLAIAFGCVIIADPAQAAPALASDTDLLPTADTHAMTSNAMASGDGPMFGHVDAAGSAGDDAMFAAAEIVETGELGDQRGGFVLDGLEITLGAQIQTLINGELALTSAVTWSDTGIETSQFVSDALSAPTAAQLQAGLLKTGNISLNVGDATVYLANDGQTALIQNVETGIQNLIFNTANNTDIQMQVNATIDLSGYTGFQASQLNSTLSNYLGMAIDAATINAITR